MFKDEVCLLTNVTKHKAKLYSYSDGTELGWTSSTTRTQRVEAPYLSAYRELYEEYVSAPLH